MPPRSLASSALLLAVLISGRTAGAVPILSELPLRRANDVSADGQVVVGTVRISGVDLAARWTASGGVEVLDASLPDGDNEARAASQDGSAVGGNRSEGSGSRREAFLWTPSGYAVVPENPVSSAYDFVHGISADGLTLVGDRGSEAFRWTSASGIEILPSLAGQSDASARAASADGSVVVGGAGDAGFEAVRWTSAGLDVLGDFGGPKANVASAVTPDGSVIVGSAYRADGLQEAFLWTEAGGMVGLGIDFGFGTHATDVSADGSRIVGVSRRDGNSAFLWDPVNGLQLLANVLADGYGLDLTGWDLDREVSISDDGLTLVGWGSGPTGARSWMLQLDPGAIPSVTNSPPLPEPATVALLAPAALAWAAARRTRAAA